MERSPIEPGRKLQITAPAREDISGILDLARREWGDLQRVCTRQRLNDAFSRIRRCPEIGRERPEFGEGVRSLATSPYMVLYRREPGALFVSRVMHERQDVSDNSIETSAS